MTEKTYKICSNCGHTNQDNDYCQKCGEIINLNLKRILKRKESSANKRKIKTIEHPNKLTSFFENVKEHKNPMVRWVAKFFYSIWIVALGIGTVLALLVAYIAA